MGFIASRLRFYRKRRHLIRLRGRMAESNINRTSAVIAGVVASVVMAITLAIFGNNILAMLGEADRKNKGCSLAPWLG